MADDEKMKLYEVQAEIIETQETLKKLSAKERQLNSIVNNVPLTEEPIFVSTDLEPFKELIKTFDEAWSKRFSTMEDALHFQRIEMSALKEELAVKDENYKNSLESLKKENTALLKEKNSMNDRIKQLKIDSDNQKKSIESLKNELAKNKADQIKTGQLANTLQAKKDTKIQNQMSDLFKKQASAEKKFSKIKEDLDYCLNQLTQESETNEDIYDRLDVLTSTVAAVNKNVYFSWMEDRKKYIVRWIIFFDGFIYDIHHLINEDFSIYEKFIDDKRTVTFSKEQWRLICKKFVGAVCL